MKKIVLSVDGMTCSACSNGLEKYLNKQEGIKSVSVNLIMNNASIEYDEKLLTNEDLDRFIKEAGFKSLGKYVLNFEEKQTKNEKIRLIIGSVLSVFAIALSMVYMFNWHFIESSILEPMSIFVGVFLFIISSIVIILNFNIIKNGIKNLIHRTPNMDTLVTIGVVTSFVFSTIKLLETILSFNNIVVSEDMSFNAELFIHNMHFEALCMTLFFVSVGKYIEHKSINKTKEAIQKLVTITPKSATLLIDGEEKEITIDEVVKGDVLICKPGQKIAVDGQIVDGNTHLDESFITGESSPVKKNIGDKVIAGSMNYDGTIHYKAEKIGKESTISEIVQMVSKASSTKTSIGNLADKISGVFVPIIIIIAIVTLVSWMLISKDVSHAVKMFVSVLVVACPCGLGLATPLAIVVASGKASQNGILIKKGDSLENAHKIKNLVFDKTGTLTYGTLKVSKIINYSSEKIEDILKGIASIEKKSEHPISKAIVNYAKENNIMIVACKDFKSIPGMGVYGKIKEDSFYIGNKKLAVEEKVLSSNDDDEFVNRINKDEEELASAGNSIIYVIKNNAIVCMIGVKDIVRNDAKKVVKELEEMDINVVMLTGDNSITAKKIANEISISEVIANCSPKEKAEKIKEFKDSGITAMCGDGINDSVSLINSDIGIGISDGTDISIDSADVVLMNNDLNKIIELIKLSKKTIRIIKQNLFWAFIYNILMIPVACGILIPFGIEINPMIGSFFMMLSSIIVVLNSLRLKKYNI